MKEIFIVIMVAFTACYICSCSYVKKNPHSLKQNDSKSLNDNLQKSLRKEKSEDKKRTSSKTASILEIWTGIE